MFPPRRAIVEASPAACVALNQLYEDAAAQSKAVQVLKSIMLPFLDQLAPHDLQTVNRLFTDIGDASERIVPNFESVAIALGCT